ncbi:MAG TPA: NADP-dependent oxidoreductase [Stellaceae bacterium]|nr:NADP-dependent oxidoreductase [Stellaceae bacterium]
MKANYIQSYGGAGVVTFGELPAPAPGPDDVLVTVKATSVNPIDWKIREGYLKANLALKFPYVLGRDFSGVVTGTGANVHDFTAGDEVFGVVDGVRGGAHGEILATNQELVAKKPKSLDHVAAASLPLAAATAMISLDDTGKLKSGERILIHGGAGAVGAIAVQFAKSVGAWVAATAGRANLARLRELGADLAIDYDAEDFTARVKDLDLVYDTVGGEVHRRSQAVLRPGGRLVYISAAPLPPGEPRPGITIARADIRGKRPLFERLARLVDDGKIKPQAARVMKLSQAGEAYEMSRTGVRGKIVLTA